MKTNSILQLLEKHKIVIPPIQRDYAQGRSKSKITYIRNRFLDSIVEVLNNDDLPPLELDFVYGYTEKDTDNAGNTYSIFKPLDGQQRLTTLFLLHWYVAQKENKMDEASKLLSRFSYATRQSSRSFCEKLITNPPPVGIKSIDKAVINEPWFFSAWQSDPTISSMLVVLKDFEVKLEGLDNIWKKLTGTHPRIIFHLLPMEDLGLPDDLYIKMNARGKELTDFEYFKSQFSEILESEEAKVFSEKIDFQWSDLFWNIFKDKESKDIAKDVDSGFLSFFWYITDILIAKNNIVVDDKFWLNTVKGVYQKNTENVKFLFESLNLFESLEKTSHDIFTSLFYIDEDNFDISKTRIFFNSPQTNLFRKCVETYGYEGKPNGFSIGEQLMLYALIYMKLNNKFNSSKFRTLRNIFSSSEDQLRKDYLATFLYNDVESLIDNNQYSINSKLSKRQYEEEKFKSEFLAKHPEIKEALFKLEDHHLLRGNISAFTLDLELPKYATQFHRIFSANVNYYEVSRSMLTIGDYSQQYGNLKRLGNRNNSTWRELFTPSDARKGFENTSQVLKLYLNLFILDQKKTQSEIIEAYLKEFVDDDSLPKYWIYYYIKYISFILWDGNQTNGFYKWDDYNNRPYEFLMLFRTQFNGRHWNPFLLEICQNNPDCKLEDYGNDLQYTHGDIIFMIKNLNNGFKFNANDQYSSDLLNNLIVSKTLNNDAILIINQNNDGIDLEDRIFKCNNFLTELSKEIDSN